MGHAKQLWAEEEARGYHTSNDAVCMDCFDDPAIRDLIGDHVESDTCSICGKTAHELIAAPADRVLEFFLGKVQEHYQNADGNAPFDNEDRRYFVPTWTMSDLVFDEFQDIGGFATLRWLYAHLKDDVVYCKRDWQIMTPAEALKSAWEQFCHAVKHETRYLFFVDDAKEDDAEPYRIRPEEMLRELGNVICECGLTREIPAGTRMFRVRGHDAGKSYTEPIDLGPPPEKCAKSAGRMNAPGIVVMYASFDRSIALGEATGSHTNFTVAEFESLKNLRVVDLTNIPPVPSIFEGGQREYLQFLRRFATDVSQPFTPDTEIHVEYTPTQVVSEYLRHRFHDSAGSRIKGLLYRSAKDCGGINVALFIEAEEVEGVPSELWKRKEPVLRLVDVKEVTPIP